MDGGRDREEELLMRILKAGRNPEDPELKRVLAEDGELRQRVDELWGLDAALGTAGEALRAEADEVLGGVAGGDGEEGSLAGNGGSATAPVEDRVRARVLELARTRGAVPWTASTGSPGSDPAASARSPWGVRRFGWIAAGVAILLLALRFLLPPANAPLEPGSDSTPRGRVLLGTSLDELSPSGTVEAFGTFSWSDLDLGMGRYEVHVMERDGGAPVTLERGLRRPHWTPDPSRAATWPDSIRWTVFAYDASGALVASAEATAERSSD